MAFIYKYEMYESETLFPSLFLRINFIDNFIFIWINKIDCLLLNWSSWQININYLIISFLLKIYAFLGLYLEIKISDKIFSFQF